MVSLILAIEFGFTLAQSNPGFDNKVSGKVHLTILLWVVSRDLAL